MVRRATVARASALLSALMLCAAAGAQGLSSGSAVGSALQGTMRAGQPALAASPTQSTAAQMPAQGATPTPSASAPLPGQSTQPAQLPPLNATGVGGQSAMTVPPGGVPTRSSTAAEAFAMMDRGQVGYVTRTDTDRIPGFTGFDNADTNRDGQLSREEFVNAWRNYSGQ